MLSASGSVTELLQFITNVFAWIILPAFSIAAGLTILLHYREKKKRTKDLPDPAEMIFLLQAEKTIHKKNQEEYIIFDHSDLIRDYKHRLAYSHARCFVLQQDLSELRSKYHEPAQNAGPLLSNLKKENMETPEVNMDTTTQNFSELENISLSEQLNMPTASDDQRSILQEENLALKKKIAEQDWLQELVNEKRSEVEFLQNQLEQRIRNQHHTVQETESLKTRLMELENSIMDREKKISENNEILVVTRQDLQSRTDQVTWLENEWKQAKEQNEFLHANAADRGDEVKALQEKLLVAGEKLETMDKRFTANKQLLKRFYRELSNYIDQETEQTPVIELQQGISSGLEDNEWAESTVYTV
jgi:chromosome segregation ATPase